MRFGVWAFKFILLDGVAFLLLTTGYVSASVPSVSCRLASHEDLGF